MPATLNVMLMQRLIQRKVNSVAVFSILVNVSRLGKKTAVMRSFFLWSCGESNPGPEMERSRFLHAE
jgi:hypothetical protein